jgi:hypothetical protein
MNRDYIPIKKVTDDTVEIGYRKLVDHYERYGNTAALKALELERKGGWCHYCNAPFTEIKLSNLWADFSYFVPSCQCYKKCDHKIDENSEEICGRVMVEERFRNLSDCLVCRGDPEKKKSIEEKKKRIKAMRRENKE